MNVLVIAPHPDDETLGCGGTLLRHKSHGDAIHWLIVTNMTAEAGYHASQMETRNAEIQRAAQAYGFASVTMLDQPSGGLDTIPLSTIVSKIAAVLLQTQAAVVYLPFPGDAHSDHAVVFQAAGAGVKNFRSPWIKRVLAYETLSETDFGLNPHQRPFQPNVFVDISPYIEEKIALMNIFASEIGAFPFPRSETTIRAQASLRGSAAGCHAAESFMLLKEIVS